MLAKLFVLFFCAVCAVCAYPYEPEPLAYEYELPSQELYRVRREDKQPASPYKPEEPPKWPQLQGEGGGSRRDGFDVHLNGRAPVWESDNKRHSFDATGGYSQHLGGPWGNSKPDYRVGGVYTYRW